jgi:hypothetical protein
MVRLPRLCTSLLRRSAAFDAFVLDIHSSFRGGHCVDDFLCHRWEPSPTVPVSKVRQMVLRQMVVSQQFRTEVCSLRLAQIRRPKDRLESVSVTACSRKLSHRAELDRRSPSIEVARMLLASTDHPCDPLV